MKPIKTFLCRHFPRYKLRCILHALNLEPRQWQMDYALGRSNHLPPGRASGKTVAVMLRALMQGHQVDDLTPIIAADPDYTHDNLRFRSFYRHEYDRLQQKCSEAGVPTPKTKYSPSWRHGYWWEV